MKCRHTLVLTSLITLLRVHTHKHLPLYVDHCPCLQASLQLTQEQQRDLMVARTFVLTSLATLLHERTQLAAALQVSCLASDGLDCKLPHCIMCSRLSGIASRPSTVQLAHDCL